MARTFQVTGGASGVPSNATAVTGNLTVTQQTSLGFLYLGPNPANNPTSSTLNFPMGDDRANAVTVALGPGGTLSATFAAPTLGPSAQVIFDVTGYFTPDPSGATYHSLTPTRLLDSRNGTGLSGSLSSHLARTFTVTGGIVPSNATAVTGNLTVTGQSSLGFLYIGPDAAANPTSSTLNFPLGDDRANAVTVATGPGGTLSVTYAAPTLGQSAQVIFDVTGYFTPDASGATYFALNPTRVLDSRNGTGLSGPLGSHVARTFGATGGTSGVPASATAITGNLTVTQQTSLGFLYIGPDAAADPTSSTLNFPKGDDRANAVTVALRVGGSLSVTYAAPTLGPTAQVVLDVTGYFAQ
jgi:serine protease inhibitor ecotin